MTALAIPAALKDEFATVEAIWGLTHASTRGLDALILTWVKYEKQTRRLFSFLVLQHFGEDSVAQAAVKRAILASVRESSRATVRAEGARSGVRPLLDNGSQDTKTSSGAYAGLSAPTVNNLEDIRPS